MNNLELTGRFKKDIKKVEKSGLDMKKIKRVIVMLEKGEVLPPKYRDHKLV